MNRTWHLETGDVRLCLVGRDIYLQSLDGDEVTGSVLLGRAGRGNSVVDLRFALNEMASAVDSLLPCGWVLMSKGERNTEIRRRVR